MHSIIKIGVLSAVIATLSMLGNIACQAAVGGKSDSLIYSFYFRQGDDLLMRDYRENKRSFAAMEQWMTAENIARIVSIRIVGGASPEGVLELNNQLALKRARAVRSYIAWRWSISGQQRVTVERQADHLAFWDRAVELDADVPRRDRVLEILHSNSSVATKWANIQLLVGGASQYMATHIFPLLRNGVACVITFNEPEGADQITTTPETSKEATAAEKQTQVSIVSCDTTAAKPAILDSIIVSDTVPRIGEQTPISDKTVVEPSIVRYSKPLFAIKTNLLFDVAALPNIELEIPIGKRFSIAGEVIFPWWLWERQQNCLQMLSGNIEGRYWFGNRDKRALLTGWFAGLYMGGGYYDLEWNRKGYQGEFFIAAGISAGYAHTISKNKAWRMEYSVGLGYLQTNYRSYEAKIGSDDEWHLYRRETGRYTWLGPTRAKISLVWMINTNGKGRGAR